MTSSPPTECPITVADGVTLRTLVHEGALRPFLLVHGLASNARLWDGTAAALAERGHTVVAVDQRGHGRSSKPDHGYDFATIVADLVAVIDALQLERPVAAGQSWGGNVVVELGAHHPDRIGGIIAVDGGFIELADRFESWDACRAALSPPALVGTPLTVMEQRIRSFHPSWPEEGLRGALANFEVRDDGTVAPWLTFDRHLQILRALYEHHPSAVFPSIEVPVLLVPADTGDVAWTADKRAAVDAALDALPNGSAHWFSPADHDIHAQHPLELAELFARWESTLR